MKPFRSLSMGACALGLGLCAMISGTLADDSELHGVADIDVFSNAVPEVIVKNVAGNHNLQNLKLALQGNTIPVPVSGYIECTGTQSENLTVRRGHFLSGGAFGIGRTSLLMSENLPNSNSIDHVSDLDAHNFQMPVALLANPQIAIDPAAIVLAAAEQAPNKVAYLRKNHIFMVKFPIRWESTCVPYTRYKVKKKTLIEAGSHPLSFVTKDVWMKIKYQGDPALTDGPALSAQLGGNLANQIQSPFKITSMTFQPNMPHHVGACPAKTTIRVNYTGQGKGQIKIQVRDNGQHRYTSTAIAFDSKNGKQHHDFEIAVPKPPQHQLNQTKHHNLRVYVLGKAENEQSWPINYKQMGAALWKHRCTPVLNPILSGGNTGQVGGYQNQGQGAKPATPKLPLRAVPATPGPARQAPN